MLAQRLRHTERQASYSSVSTLLWSGDDLVDVTSGLRIHPDCSVSRPTCFLGYPFDRAIGLRLPNVQWAVAYANRGTKAVLIRDGVIERELNRSYYMAEEFDYPITLSVLRSGQAVVVHCPNTFDTLEVDDIETGMTLAAAKTPDMEFHSRLAVSPCGRFLLNAGWFWHPLGGACVIDLEAFVEDCKGVRPVCSFSFGAEIGSAAFLGTDKVVVSSTEQVVNEISPPRGMRIGVWSMVEAQWCSMVAASEPSGTIMPWRDWVIAFHDHPKAIDLATGAIVHRWNHLYSGRQIGSYALGDPPPPPMALDAQGGRFAIANGDQISIVSLEAD